jgi:hypothetical protein
MSSNFDAMKVARKTGKEQFHIQGRGAEFDLLGFWQWSASNLVSNALRGVLAEYIVASDLSVAHGVRTEWDAYDLKTPGGIKVEVKSAAYLQSWRQSAPSKICFDIRPTYGWDSATNTTSVERKRQADVYVFCLLAHPDKATLDPMDLAQWEFYVLSSKVLDEKLPNQKTVSLAGLLRLGPTKAGFGNISRTIYDLF